MAQAMLRLLATPTTRAVVPSSSSGTRSSRRRPGEVTVVPAARIGGHLAPPPLAPAVGDGHAPFVQRALVALVAVAALLASAGTALGHALLVSTSPPADARMTAAPELVTLTFSEPV